MPATTAATTIAITSDASANAAATAARNAARTAECRPIVEAFQSAGASVQQMREYASCVSHLYPAPSSGTEILALKALAASFLLFVLVGVLIGAFSRGDSYDSRSWKMINGAMSGFMSWVCVLVVVGVIAFLIAA